MQESSGYGAQMAWKRAHHGGGGVVDAEAEGSPPVEDDGEDPCPDGDQWHRHECGCADGANNIRPHALAVHDALQQRQLGLEQRAVLVVEENLEVALHSTTSARLDLERCRGVPSQQRCRGVPSQRAML